MTRRVFTAGQRVRYEYRPSFNGGLLAQSIFLDGTVTRVSGRQVTFTLDATGTKAKMTVRDDDQFLHPA